jgi:hypothetical protein
MSTTTFVEATSADPFIRDLHRRAVRLLNDPSLDRQQREFHMRRLQSILLGHQEKQAAKAARVAQKKAAREQISRTNRNQGVADPSQVLARRKELALVSKAAAADAVKEQPKEAVAAANQPMVGSHRPVLTLKRA